MTCNNATGICELSSPCSNYVDELMLSLKWNFAHTDTYIIMPLAAFANTTNNDTCELFFQVVNSTITDDTPEQMILGSMFLQAFSAQFKFARES